MVAFPDVAVSFDIFPLYAAFGSEAAPELVAKASLVEGCDAGRRVKPDRGLRESHSSRSLEREARA